MYQSGSELELSTYFEIKRDQMIIQDQCLQMTSITYINPNISGLTATATVDGQLVT